VYEKMNYAVKVMLFQEGRYQLRLQPMATSGWTLRDWIGFVDRFGRWAAAGPC
jgi:hypothetical protein